MEISAAKQFINRNVMLSWTDRKGDVVAQDVFVFDVNFVPFYGPCFITSVGEVRLDRVQDCLAHNQEAA